MSTQRFHFRFLPQDGQGNIAEDVDLQSIGATTILKPHRGVGHWRLSGGVVTLAQLFRDFGATYTAYDLMAWYLNAPKMIKKRPHPVGLADERAAAHLRKELAGKWGKRG